LEAGNAGGSVEGCRACLNVSRKLLFTDHLASCSVGLFVNVTVRPLIGILVKLRADEVR
jgi:hypothetical protein